MTRICGWFHKIKLFMVKPYSASLKKALMLIWEYNTTVTQYKHDHNNTAQSTGVIFLSYYKLHTRVAPNLEHFHYTETGI